MIKEVCGSGDRLIFREIGGTRAKYSWDSRESAAYQRGTVRLLSSPNCDIDIILHKVR